MGFGLEKQLKFNNCGVAVNGGSGCNMVSVRNMYCPSTIY